MPIAHRQGELVRDSPDIWNVHRPTFQQRSSADRLEGTLTILPGATVAPADLQEYRRTHRVHTIRVRAGTFAEDSLTSGPALLIMEIRGRQPAHANVDVPARSTREIVLMAGAPQ